MIGGMWSRWYLVGECACLGSLCGLIIFSAFIISLYFTEHVEDNIEVALYSVRPFKILQLIFVSFHFFVVRVLTVVRGWRRVVSMTFSL